MRRLPSLIPFLALLLLLWLPTGMWPADGPTPAKPAATAQDWHQDPAAAKKDADGQANTTAATAPEPASFWTQAAGWAAGALGLAIALGKFVPGIGGIVAQVAGPVYDLVVSKKVRDAEARRDTMADGFATILHLIEILPKDAPIADLKAKISARLPSEAQDIVNSWLAQREAAKVASVPTPVLTPATAAS